MFTTGNRAVEVSRFKFLVKYDDPYDVVVYTCTQAVETALGVQALAVRRPSPGFGSVVNTFSPTVLGNYPDQWVFSLGSLSTTSVQGVWYHTSKTESGTSGSPVFNRDGFVVGIHWGACPKTKNNMMTSIHWIGSRRDDVLKETSAPHDDIPIDGFLYGHWEEDDIFIPDQYVEEDIYMDEPQLS